MGIKRIAWISAVAAFVAAGVALAGAAQDKSVQITESGFVPARMEVTVGQKVMFHNATKVDRSINSMTAGEADKDKNLGRDASKNPAKDLGKDQDKSRDPAQDPKNDLSKDLPKDLNKDQAPEGDSKKGQDSSKDLNKDQAKEGDLNRDQDPIKGEDKARDLGKDQQRDPSKDRDPGKDPMKDKANLDSGVIKPAGSWEHTFTKPGTYSYYSKESKSATGTIVVKAAK